MGRVNTPLLDEPAKTLLNNGFRTGTSHCFRMRCQVLLLKASGCGSQEVGALTGMSAVSVNAWVKRYGTGGLAGLHTRAGRGRKPLLTKAADETLVLEHVKANRQRIQTAKAEWSKASGKQVGLTTFKSFLKALTADTNASANGARAPRTRPSTG